jgi:concentrative nucleoside transporter, CNT family
VGLRPRRHADRLQRGGTSFVFGPLLGVGDENETIFALQVLPVIIFLGALIGLLFYLRVIQYLTYVSGGAIS